MQSIKATELRSHLSRYLRKASRGERITVRDRDGPIAELGPAGREPLSWRDRLIGEGRLRPGTQEWGALTIRTPERRACRLKPAFQAVGAVRAIGVATCAVRAPRVPV